MRLTTFAAGILTFGADVRTHSWIDRIPGGEAQQQPALRAGRTPVISNLDSKARVDNRGRASSRCACRSTSSTCSPRCATSSTGIVSNLKQEDFKILEDGAGAESCVFLERSEYADHAGPLDRYQRQHGPHAAAEQDAASRFLREVMRPKD